MQLYDMLNRALWLPQAPQRIVCLVPSITELLVNLGLEERIVGITKFCVEPAGLKQKKNIVGGTKTLNYERIDNLKPDLIVANKEENTLEIIANLEQKYAVWVSDVLTVQDALSMITRLGIITQTDAKASEITGSITRSYAHLSQCNKTALYLIWQKPYMAAGLNTFIDCNMRLLGLRNLAQSMPGRYPEMELTQIIDLKPNFILLSSEPFPFKQKHVDTLKKQLPSAQVVLVDGMYFSWYGSRMMQAGTYFNDLIAQLNVEL